MDNLNTRNATLNDLPTLLRFEQSLILAERPFDPTLKEGSIHYYDIEAMINADHIELIVAEFNSEIIGCGYARIENAKHYLKHEQYAYLGFMYIDPFFRGKGVNKIIVEELKKWALSRNLTEIRLEVYNNNESAIKAYEKAGFERYMVQMRMGIILTLISFLFCTFSFGQTKLNDLSEIKTISQAKKFIKNNPNAEAKLITIESSKDTTEVFLSFYDKKNGFITQIDNSYYKILSLDSALSFRVSYIYLSSERYSKNQVDLVRQEIISKYNAGTSFLELVKQFNMDGNMTGNTDWFTEGMMVKEFEKEVKNHKKNEIFTVDVPEHGWYHVVLKTFDDTFIKKITILKVKESNQQ